MQMSSYQARFIFIGISIDRTFSRQRRIDFGKRRNQGKTITQLKTPRQQTASHVMVQI